MRIMIPALVLIACLAAAGSAAAEDQADCGNTPKAKWMSEDAIKAKAAGEGFEVRQVKIEGSCYEIKAIDKSGARVERVVNPVTGAFVANEEGE